MKEKNKAMVLASFAADSLALGAHWIYDTRIIDQKFGRIEQFQNPLENSFHSTKHLGEFTHYGDQTLWLMESVASTRTFDLKHFAQTWKRHLDGYKGYIDQATRTTLKHFSISDDPTISGSDSDDLGGAARIAPLGYVFSKDKNRFIAACRMQTAMTHNHPYVIDAAEFFARVTMEVLNRTTPPARAIQNVLTRRFDREPFVKWVSEGIDSVAMDTRSAILKLGQMCEIDAAFPSVIHLIVKYQDNLKLALIENVMAGGDSAARGLLTGMILGARHGCDAISQKWLENMKMYDRITDFMNRI